MEFKTPPRSAVAIVQPLAEPNPDISDSHDALAKADRLEVAAVTSETPKQAVSIDEGIALAAAGDANETDLGRRPEDISIGSSEPTGVDTKKDDINASARPSGTSTPRPIARHLHNPKSKKVTTAARPKSEPKATVIKRTAISQRSKAASDTKPCRLKAFGGLQKALNSADCEI